MKSTSSAIGSRIASTSSSERMASRTWSDASPSSSAASESTISERSPQSFEHRNDVLGAAIGQLAKLLSVEERDGRLRFRDRADRRRDLMQGISDAEELIGGDRTDLFLAFEERELAAGDEERDLRDFVSGKENGLFVERLEPLDAREHFVANADVE